MVVEILLFGQLTDIAGNSRLMIDNIADTDQLVRAVNKLYPAMTSVKYIIAVDKKAIQSNTALSQTTTVALLPPFSGG